MAGKRFVSFLFILILAVGIYLGLIAYAKSQSFTYTDFALYLENGTYFEETAASVLPPKNLLTEAELIFYEYDFDYNFLCEGDSSLRLVVAYEEEKSEGFSNAQKTLKDQYQAADSMSHETFYFDDRLYYAYTFYNNTEESVRAYAMAYSIDESQRRISYLLYESFDMQIMSAQDALSMYFGRDRIRSAS